ncbi:16S rRNA (uracil(1498)-N(3))-methyltransferase [Cohnella endophytica]|uniref:Ribosomal RNA small subunit methyltransferase E n=1 Tax=Cohnella endophytica TaxID=2419778 RepID=A0A494XXI6_9BACL|nr:16S rRNA (uracil(1498)-N(3))-methyltransferase [Cohnella endophytica]RKP55202.1 16S rRNA (uracil(1498)-N(3))-methyltransferase [Cohnella endophytica]
MQRYFVPPALMGQQSVMLEGDDARHAAAVMRSKPGDCFIACDGCGRDVLAKITSIDKETVKADIIETLSRRAEMAWKVTVAQSLPKGDKLETVIQKGAEAGAAAFRPFLSHRTVVQYDERKEAKRIDRWRKIAKEAAEQSHRSIIPSIEAVATWKAMLALFAEYELVLFCYEEEGRSGGGLKDILSGFKASLPDSAEPRILIVVGPEGGFTQQEADQAASSGAKLVGLGTRILRTETAALYALACLAYESGELGGI